MTKSNLTNKNKIVSKIRSTTVLCVRDDKQVVMIADGQVSFGHTVLKNNASKIRCLDGGVLAGFAGSTADALTLFTRLEAKLNQYKKQLLRSCVEMAKDWRTDRVLRRLEAMLLVADNKSIYLVSGSGDIVEPEYGVAAIGSGGQYALAAARVLIKHSKLSLEEIAKESMKIAAEICVYTNDKFVIQKL